MVTLTGACHCGNVSVRLESPRPAGELALRACQCGFCRKHGVRTTSDPQSSLEIAVRDPDALSRYRFALHAADFLVCARCGVYVAALLGEGERGVATLNVNVLEGDPFAGRVPEPARYDAEDAGSRRARRLRMWTPAVVRGVR